MLHRILIVFFLAAATANLSAQSNISMELYADTYATGYNAVAAGDFNNDGKPDLVQCCSSTGLVFRAGNGDGSFQPPVNAVAASTGAAQLIATDVNGDGKLDLVGLPGYGNYPDAPPANNGVAVWLGNGDGTFQKAQIYNTNSAPDAVAVGNFFGDGHPDIAVGETGGNIEFFRNQGGGRFGFEDALNLGTGAGSMFSSLAAGNLSGNGISDLAAAFTGGSVNADATYVIWDEGPGGFTAVALGHYTEPEVNISQLNGTGTADLLVSYTCDPTLSGYSKGPVYKGCAGVDVYYGVGNHTLDLKKQITDPGVYAVGKPFGVDMNGDGIGDIVTAGAESCWCKFGLYVWTGNADGSFQQTPQRFIINTNGVGPMATADFTRNGMTDFAMDTGSGSGLGVEALLNASLRAPCGKYTINHTVTECQPVDDTYVTSPVRVQATSTDATQVTAMQVYVDGNREYSQPVTSFDTTFAVTPGPHNFTTKAWDASGVSFRAVRRVTAFNGTPGATCAVTPDAASICVPAGATSDSPVLIVANGNTGTVVPTAAQLYIDGKLVINNVGMCYSNGNCSGGTSYVETMQSLSGGTHALTFKLWDANGNFYEARKTITVN